MENKINSLAHDLANLNTYGHKRQELGFQELLTNEIHNNDVLKSDNLGHARLNLGVKSVPATINFNQGALLRSESPFNMAIEGRGFFGLYNEEGNLILTRNGGFQINEDNSISDDQGNLLSMDIYIAQEEWESGNISINRNGEIYQGVEGEGLLLARVILYEPEVLDSLTPLGETSFLVPANLGLYNSLENPESFGTIHQNYLEGSNVHMGKSMTELIVAQRAYSINLKAIQSTDDIMDVINGIKR